MIEIFEIRIVRQETVWRCAFVVSLNTMPRKAFWEKGIRFECQGSGKCCTSRGSHGYVYVTLKDRQRFAAYFGISTVDFTRKYCQKTNGFFHLRDSVDDCVYLKGTQCSVYEARPTQCRTWPFWPENMSSRAWKKEVVDFCPGVGKGRVYDGDEIRQLLKDS